MNQNDYTDRTRIIVVDIHDAAVGMSVDNISEVQLIGDSNIVPPPDYRTGAQNSYIKAIGKVGNDVKLLMDCSKLFQNIDL